MYQVINVVRWILTVPAAVLGYVIGYISGLFVFQLMRFNFGVDHFSFMSFHNLSILDWVAMPIGVSVAAILFVLLPTVIAPSHQLKVAAIAYIIGLAISIHFILNGVHFVLLAFAALSSASALWLIKAFSAKLGLDNPYVKNSFAS